MENSSVFREITPLMSEDCFIVFDRTKKEYSYPVHVHPEFELDFIENGNGVRRIVGDSIEEIADLELCLIGNETLEHGWMSHGASLNDIHEITIQFHKDLFLGSFLNKNQFYTMSVMFKNARKGIVFSRQAVQNVKEQLYSLARSENGFDSVIKLLTVLNELSLDENARILSSDTFVNEEESNDSLKIQKVINYLQLNCNNELHLVDVANFLNMSEVSFSRFIKKHTGKNYVEYLNDLRLGIASRALITTHKTISEISFECGFNNLSNFNRMFKKRKGITPKDFRGDYSRMRKII